MEFSKQKKSDLKFVISYTTDTTFAPNENTNALGQSYLGEEGQTYTKTFTQQMFINNI